MAIRDNNDNLAQFLGDGQNARRWDNWLFGWLMTQDLWLQQTINTSSINERNLREILFDVIKRRGITNLHITAERSKAFIQEPAFEWFEDSRRFYNWFKTYFYNHTFIEKSNALPINYKETCILAMDLYQAPLPSKTSELLTAKGIWKNKVKIGQHFEWIKNKTDKENCIQQAYSCIREFRPELTAIETPTSFEEFIIIIDRFLINDAEAKNASSNARRKISQIKYRNESAQKKQLNVLIDNKVLMELNALCEKHEISKAKAIEILIKTECKKNIYITEKKAAWYRGDID